MSYSSSTYEMLPCYQVTLWFLGCTVLPGDAMVARVCSVWCYGSAGVCVVCECRVTTWHCRTCRVVSRCLACHSLWAWICSSPSLFMKVVARQWAENNSWWCCHASTFCTYERHTSLTSHTSRTYYHSLGVYVWNKMLKSTVGVVYLSIIKLAVHSCRCGVMYDWHIVDILVD